MDAYVSSLLDTLLHWIYPMDCAACGAPVKDRSLSSFCRPCWRSIRPIAGPICPHCGRPLASPLALVHSPTHVCGACRERPPHFDRALSPYRYEGVLDQAIRLFKYRGRTALARPLADLALAWIDRIPVAGKTGTADIIPKQPTSWFAAMAPANDPKYVVVAMVEQGGHGSTTAAPIVRQIIQGIYHINGQLHSGGSNN